MERSTWSTEEGARPPAGHEPELQDAFGRIERQVDEGNPDLGRLGFWRLVAEVKADPMLERHWAEVVGRIDRKAFEARIRWRGPVWLGNTILLLGTFAGSFAVGLALGTTDEVVAGVALLLGGGIWMAAWHDLAHWMFGRIIGIRFTSYYLFGTPPWPGLKIDYASYLRTEAAWRAWMHASGAIASKVAPFGALAFWPATDAPAWAAWGLLGLGVAGIVVDVVFSVRFSDWKRVRRERRVARAQAANA